MSTVTRSQFQNALQNGVDLANPSLSQGLQGTGVTTQDLKKLDADGDGKLAGAEVDKAFKLVDDFDRNGSGRSFNNSGTAGQVFSALKAGVAQGAAPVARQGNTPSADAVATAAADRAAKDSSGYAWNNAPTSPNRNLSGNKIPGQTRPSWLENNNKCNQFVGDSLTQAGFKMPAYKMTDGTEHYVNAEKLPTYNKHFDRITDPANIKPGDVFVLDYPGSGESTAHTEVITGYDPATGNMKTTGAHGDGAYERDRGAWLNDMTYNAAGKHWEDASGNKLYILRPKMAQPPYTAPIRG
ncbi:MAG: hypothetical protein HY904_10055 [Deltaproteobacteria bacterium]|nr:hypothetical protein [Deltaproteobacteria bacterium]